MLHDLLNNPALAQAGLNKLKSAFTVFVENRQQFPLVYESAWGGCVSSASYTLNDPGADFGNTYYNDHHFQFVSLSPQPPLCFFCFCFFCFFAKPLLTTVLATDTSSTLPPSSHTLIPPGLLPPTKHTSAFSSATSRTLLLQTLIFRSRETSTGTTATAGHMGSTNPTTARTKNLRPKMR